MRWFWFHSFIIHSPENNCYTIQPLGVHSRFLPIIPSNSVTKRNGVYGEVVHPDISRYRINRITILWMVAKSCTTKRMVETIETRTEFHGMFTTYQLVQDFRNHPQYVLVESYFKSHGNSPSIVATWRDRHGKQICGPGFTRKLRPKSSAKDLSESFLLMKTT